MKEIEYNNLGDGYKTIEFKTLKGGLIQVIIYSFLE